MGLVDVAMYAAVVEAKGQSDAVTASLTINFLRKSPPGPVFAEARLLKTGRLCAGEVFFCWAKTRASLLLILLVRGRFQPGPILKTHI